MHLYRVVEHPIPGITCMLDQPLKNSRMESLMSCHFWLETRHVSLTRSSKPSFSFTHSSCPLLRINAFIRRRDPPRVCGIAFSRPISGPMPMPWISGTDAPKAFHVVGSRNRCVSSSVPKWLKKPRSRLYSCAKDCPGETGRMFNGDRVTGTRG